VIEDKFRGGGVVSDGCRRGLLRISYSVILVKLEGVSVYFCLGIEGRATDGWEKATMAL